MTLTAARLREIIVYDRLTGIFTWRVTRNNAPAGTVAGGRRKKTGYISVGVDRQRYQAHQLAWLYTYGRWPSKRLDHRNGIRHDNALSNLRTATSSQNAHNSSKHSDNTSGLKGVSWDKTKGKWQAKICVKYRQIHLGRFNDIAAAAEAYAIAARKYHGKFARLV